MGIIAKIYKRKIQEETRKRRLALETAKRIALILGRRFGARKVILYGSLAEGKYFDSVSDIDIAVSGIGDKYFKALSYCKDLTEFAIDIRDYDEMPAEFKKKLEQKGRFLYERGREIRK